MNLRSASLVLAFVIPGTAVAAPCDQGFPLKLGTVAEITRYNESHQPTGKIVSTIVSSVEKGDTVTAVATVDNYLGATKASTSTVDLVCDGKKISMNVRNDNAMKDWYGKAAAELAKKGQKLLAAQNFSEPQIYPLELKVGDELPPWRAFSMTVIQKAPPDWGKIAMTGDWFAALKYAMHMKFAGGVQMITAHIKVVGQETCKMPDGASVPCFRITKEMFAKPLAGEADLTGDVNKLAKGTVPTIVTEWYAPGFGGIKSEIGPAGHPIGTMARTALKTAP